MAQLEELVISAIEEDVLAPDIVEASIARAVEILTEADVSNGDADRVAREIATIDRELERLALAAAGGSDIPTVLEALRTRHERRRELKPATTNRIEVELWSDASSWTNTLRQEFATAYTFSER